MLKLEENLVGVVNLIFFEIELNEKFSEKNLKDFIDGEIDVLCNKYRVEDLKKIPEILEFRKILKSVGLDPSKHRISVEALYRRILKKKSFPHIFPLVDINNFLSLKLFLPVCVYKKESIKPPLKLRYGKKGEKLESLKGRFSLEGKITLEDSLGPFGSPFIDDRRVLLTGDESAAYGDIYIPSKFEVKDYVERGEGLISKIEGVNIRFFV